jgi:uncharacterized iron-regulated membrane protein
MKPSLQVASRAMAAIVGGYTLAALVAAGMAVWLPMPRVEAVMTGMLVSFAIHAAVAIAAFSRRHGVKGGLRQSMAWLHTWAGLLVSWLLLAIFMTGTSAYFQDEITRWMQPEIRGERDPVAAAEGAVAWLSGHAAGADRWTMTLPGRRALATTVYWKPAGPAKGSWRDHLITVDGGGHKVDVRDTTGGFFLYRLHFDLHYMPVLWARWIVGFCAMFMLVAIVSGVITHRKIFADFFTLRFGKGQRSWLDAHNLTAVLALPFHLMITYTGLVTLASLYMPWGIDAAYRTPDEYSAEAFGIEVPRERSGHAAPIASIGAMIAQARTQWHGADPGFITLELPGDANGTVRMTLGGGEAMGARGETLTFDAATGKLHDPVSGEGGAMATQGVMIGLHAGRYAPTLLRWFYFLCGLTGTAMVATGLVLWTAKRRLQLPDPERPHLGFRLVERLNIATVAGLPFGMACYFMANRLLPLDLPQRAVWEAHSFFIAWGAVLVYACLRAPRRGWIETLSIAAVAFAMVPLVNAATTSRNLVASVMAGDAVFAGFDLAMLMLAGLFGFTAWKVYRRQAVPVRKARRARTEVTA